MDFNSANALQSTLTSKPLAQESPQGPAAHAGALFADFASTLRAADEAALSTVVGGADPQTMVEAMAQAQLAMETAVTVRDRAVEAYQEIMRMPV